MMTVGKVKSAHGIFGQLYLLVFSGELTPLLNLSVVQLVHPLSGEHKDLKVSELTPHKQGVIVTCPEITNRNSAEALKGYLWEVDESLYQSKPGEKIYLREILGFKVTDVTRGSLGEIIGFSSNGAQDLIVIQEPNVGSFEAPLVKPLLREIDFKSGVVHVDLPEGLVPGDSED